MKTFAATILVFSFIWQSLFQSAFLGYWKYNQGEIIATKCINRFKPMMHCEGKCFLYRELKKAADAEAENNKIPEAVLKLKTIDYCIVTPAFWQWDTIYKNTSKTNFRKPNVVILAGHSLLLLKPPVVTA